MPKKKKDDIVEPIKLDETETKLIRGYLAQQELVRIQAQSSIQALQAEIQGIAGEGHTLEQKEDGIYRVPVSEE